MPIHMDPSCYPHHPSWLHLAWSTKYWTSEHKAIDEYSDCHRDACSSHPNSRASSTRLPDQQSDSSCDRWDGSHRHGTDLGDVDSGSKCVPGRVCHQLEPSHQLRSAQWMGNDESRLGGGTKLRALRYDPGM